VVIHGCSGTPRRPVVTCWPPSRWGSPRRVGLVGVVLDRGKVARRGTHDRLMRAGGPYRRFRAAGA